MSYQVIPFQPTPERAGVVSTILQEVIRFESIFTDFARGCNEHCGHCPLCLSRKALAARTLSAPDTLAWEVWELGEDDARIVGLIYLTDVVPGRDACAHYVFFDGRLRSRTEVLEGMIQWAFHDHPDLGWAALERLTVEIPDFAGALARHATRHLGFGGDFRYRIGDFSVPVEGVKRGALPWRGHRRNLLVLGRLNDLDKE